MDKKLSDPFTDAELDVINRYRLERRARQYDGKIEKDTPERIVVFVPARVSHGILGIPKARYEIIMTEVSEKTGFRIIKANELK